MSKKLYFLNSFYQRPRFAKSNGKYVKVKNDFLQINLKDCETNETKLMYLENPDIDFYVTKSRDYTYPRMSMPKTELTKIRCKYADKDRELAKAIGKLNEFYDACRTPARWEVDFEGNPYKVDYKRKFMQNEIYNSPFIYMGDMDIEDLYKNYFMEKYGRDIYLKYGKFKQAFLDIEADQYRDDWNIEDFTAPINSVTYLDLNTNTLYALALNNQPENQDLIDVMNNKDDFLINFVKREACDDDLKYDIRFYNDESDLLVNLWRIIHITKPDFCGIWNMNFDIPYILKRMTILGLNLEEICCHPEVDEKFRVVYYKEDKDRNANRLAAINSENKHPSRLWDWVYISGYTQFYDMMALYSLIRKRYILPSYKLDEIAFSETGYRKLDYHTMGYTIRKLAHQNFKIFLAYSIIDTIRLKQIEAITSDLHRTIIFCDNTKIENSQKISVVIKNDMYRFYLDNPKGPEIIGNNVSYNIKEKIDGAIIASPDKLKIAGRGILNSEGFVYDNVVDFDQASEYPRVILSSNISKNSLYGRVVKIINNEVERTDDPSEFNKLLQTLDTSIFELMTKYYGLPTVDELLHKIEKAYYDMK